MLLGSTYGETAWAACESVIRRFEDAWRENERPDVGDFVSPDGPHSVRLLVELVHIDLEFRLRAGDCARAEDYLARFPELGEPEHTVELLAAEFALRNRHTPPAWPEEFWLRFPEHTAELRTRLPVGGTGWFAVTRPAERPGAPLVAPALICTSYEIQGELGRGGMGVVYKARDLLLHRTVAVKTFATVPRPESCARFAREAEAIARLDHPNIVPVYDVGEWRAADDGPGVPYFVMKWYPGGSLDAAPAGPGTDIGAQARTVETIARAVHHAHQRGILHRDLKPSNILLDDAGRPHVADFGLAGRVDPDAPTATAVVAGTPAYMAPEQARSPKTVSTAADVYGLGAILYHQLTGRAPFAADTPLATLDRVANEPPAPPSAANPAVPRDLDTICLKCLEKDPARRYASAAEVADDLEQWRKGLPIAARPARAWELAYRRVRRHPVVTVLALTTLAALVGAVAVLAVSYERVSEKERERHQAYLRECALRYALEDTLAREKTTRDRLKDTLHSEQRALYLERVSSAGRLYTANQLTEAWALLDECPEPFRGWEWRYLDSLRRARSTVLNGHPPAIRAAFLADGRLVSGDPHGVVRVWDTAGQRSQREWKFGNVAIGALAPHPTRPWVAVADLNGVTVFDADTGGAVAKLAGTGWVTFSPDGTRAATANGPAVRLWAVPAAPGPADWEPAGELRGHGGSVTAGVFTPDGRRLITGALDQSIRTWDLASGKHLSSRAAPTAVSGLALTAEGKLLAEAHRGFVLFTDPATGEVHDRLDYPTGERPALAGAPARRGVVIGGINGEVVVWDSLRRRVARVFRGHSGPLVALAIGPRGQLASCGADQTVRLWDERSQAEVRTLAVVGDGVGGLSISPDGLWVAVGPRISAGKTSAAVMILDAATGLEQRRLTSWPDGVFHPTTGRLVTNRLIGGVALWDPGTGAEVWNRPFEAPRPPPVTTVPTGRRTAVSPDGAYIAVWDLRAGGVQLYGPDGTARGVIDAGTRFVHMIEFSPDSTRLAVAGAEGVTMWDVATRTRITWGADLPPATALCFSPNGQWVATVDQDRTIRLRAAATGREVRSFIGSALRVSARVLCFSPDSTRLVSGGADRAARLWDVESGRELLALPSVTEAITGLAWDAKNDRIYALDHAVRVWEAKR